MKWWPTLPAAWASRKSGYATESAFNASASWAGGNKPGPLWNERERAAIIKYVQHGGGIAANHNATDMGAGTVSWDWWDGGEQSVVGTLMRGHARTEGKGSDHQVAPRQEKAGEDGRRRNDHCR